MLFVNPTSECNLVYSREPTDETYADDFLNKNEVDIIEPAKLDVSDEVRDAVLLLSVFGGDGVGTCYLPYIAWENSHGRSVLYLTSAFRAV